MPSLKSTYHPRRNHGCRIETDATLWGYRSVVLQNELLRVTVLAGKGADVAEFLYKPLDIDFLWASPNGPRPRETVYPPADSRQCFGDFYYGGWQELFPHGSKPADAYGARLPQHGEVWGLPWEVRVEEDSPARVSVTFGVRTRLLPFVLERRMSLSAESPVLEIDETACNLGGCAVDFLWGHHPAFGAPFLSGACTLYAPTRTVNVNLKQSTTWPVGEASGRREDFSRPPPPGSRAGRMLYLQDLSDGWYALVNDRLKVGFGMRWDARRFPVVWIWQEAHAGQGSPWFGNAYAMAVEPVSHMPFARERGEPLLKLKPGGKMRARFLALAIPGGRPVKNIDPAGKVR